MQNTNKRKIQECILNIDMTCKSLYASNLDRIRLKIPNNSAIHMDSIRFSYIQLCVILDELSILNRLAKNDDYLRDTLYIIAPATRALNQYPGIRKARNYLLAHLNRDKKKNFYPWWKALKDITLPRTSFELSQIYTFLILINGIIVSRYSDQLKDIFSNSKKEVDIYFKWMLEQEEKASISPKPFDNVEKEIEKRMEEKKMNEISIDSFYLNKI